MLDIRLLRKDKETIEAKLQTKDPEIVLAKILALDERIRQIKVEVEELKATRNQLSKEIGEKKEKRRGRLLCYAGCGKTWR